jgi:hypothetical protein
MWGLCLGLWAAPAGAGAGVLPIATLTPTELMLVGGGVADREELDRELHSLDQLVANLVAAVQRRAKTPAEKADALLEAMHAGPLKSYDAGTSDLRQLMRGGRFNCLSATAVYVLAAGRLGLLSKGYATRGHILALVFLADGPRYVETTSWEGSTSRTWDGRFWMAWDEAMQGADERHASMRDHLHSAAAAQVTGDNESADPHLEAAAELARQPFIEAQRREDELLALAYEVDLRTLAGLFFWNGAVSALLDGRPEAAQTALVHFAELVSPTAMAKTSGARLSELGEVLAGYGERHGPGAVLPVLDRLVAGATEPADRLMLRDLRARLWLTWLARVDADKRCELVARAIASDPTHPLVEVFARQRDRWRCPAR